MLKILKERILFGLKSCFCWLTATSHHLLKKQVWLSSTYYHPSGCDFMSRARKMKLPPTHQRKAWLHCQASPSLYWLWCFAFWLYRNNPITVLLFFFGGRCAVCLQLGCLFVFEEAGEWYHKNTFRCFFLKTSVSKLVCYQCAFWNVRTLDKLFVEVNI